MARIALPVTLTDQQCAQLNQWIGAQYTPQQVALRSRIVLLAAQGLEDLEIATELSVNRHTASLWRKRFRQEGMDAVWEIAPGRGRKPLYTQNKVARIVKATLESKPKAQTHWSCRTMARCEQVSPSTIHRIWRDHNLKPHLSRSFKLSRDAQFLEKLTDVVGLYLNPPDKSLVLCVDEKSQIQALLEQMRKPRLVAADTMDLWLNIALPELIILIKRLDLFVLNDSEAHQLTKEDNVFNALKKIHKLGPRYVIIKKGCHGSILSCPRGLFICPAYPLRQVVDPTGAGDSFVGGIMGYLASTRGPVDANIRRAMAYGSVVASFCCEGFGLTCTNRVTRAQIEKRVRKLEQLTAF